MEFVPGGRESNYDCEEQETVETLNHRPPLALLPSCSSSSSAHWAPQQTEPTDRQYPSGSSSVPSGQPRAAAHLVEKEHMFHKVVTPSDVGKLNRLVIPKQYAEKYFPLDASGNEKGMLLSFEDRTGKHWRFRYSYWNSSQSYVMTKGWSRFVKEKRLDAGDIVSFGRGVGEEGRHSLFIDWKRRPDAHIPTCFPLLPLPFHHLHHDPSSVMSFPHSAVPWDHLVVPPQASAVSFVTVYDHPGYGCTSTVASNPYLYLRPAGSPSQIAVQLGISRGGRDGAVIDSAPMAQSDAAAKTVRLFGVNLRGCSPSEAGSIGDGAAHGHPPPPALSQPQLRTRASDLMESPGGKDLPPVSLALEM